MSRMYSSETQISWVCREFLKGHELCHMDEINHVQGWRLAAIVCELQKRYDWPPFAKRQGKHGVTHYRIARGVDKKKLRLPSSYRQK